MPNLYLQISLFSILAGIIIAALATATRKWESLLEEEAELLQTKA